MNKPISSLFVFSVVYCVVFTQKLKKTRRKQNKQTETTTKQNNSNNKHLKTEIQDIQPSTRPRIISLRFRLGDFFVFLCNILFLFLIFLCLLLFSLSCYVFSYFSCFSFFFFKQCLCMCFFDCKCKILKQLGEHIKIQKEQQTFCAIYSRRFVGWILCISVFVLFFFEFFFVFCFLSASLCIFLFFFSFFLNKCFRLVFVSFCIYNRQAHILKQQK